MDTALIFYVNGAKVTEPRPDPRWTLLQYLREKLLLTGTKEGCGEGRCGACTVMVSRYNPRDQKIRRVNVNSCLVPLCSLHFAAVTTVEGIGDTKKGLHRIQESLVESHGIQCGFCTSGMVMSMYTLMLEHPHPSQEDIQTYMEGNLCRCTGYRSIIDGFTKAAQMSCCGSGGCQGCPCKSTDSPQTQDSSEVSKFKPAHPTQDIIFPPELKRTTTDVRTAVFELNGVKWMRPKSLTDFLQLVKNNPTAKVIAGGTTTVLNMRVKKTIPETLIFVSHLPELGRLELVNEEHLELGAGLTLEELRLKLPGLVKNIPEWKTRSVTALCDALNHVAATQIRNAATLGGNLLDAATVSDVQPVCVAMDAVLHVESPADGHRSIRYAEAIKLSPPGSCLRQGEIVTNISFPLTKQNEYVRFYDHQRRKGFEIAHLNAVPVISLAPGSDTIQDFHVVLGGAACPRVTYVDLTGEFGGKTWSLAHISDILSHLNKALNSGFTDDTRHLASVFLFKFLFDVDQEITGKANPSAPRPLSTADYESTRVCDLIDKDQPDHDAMRRPVPHVSAKQVVCGEALYTDDVPRREDELFAGLVLSSRAHAKLLNVDPSKAVEVPGVVGYVDHNDIPGRNLWGPPGMQEYVFAVGEVHCVGQLISLIVAKDRQVAKDAAGLVKVEYEDLPAILTLEDAIQQESFFTVEKANPKIIHGDVEEGFAQSDVIVEGDLSISAREHYYMETLGVLVNARGEHDEVDIYSSTQNPGYVQGNVAAVLGIPANRVVTHVKRIGGGFGGKETRPCMLNQPVAVASYKYKKPVRCILDRRTDMMISGKGPRIIAKYKIGCKRDGRIQGLDLHLYGEGGYASDIAYAFLQVTVMAFESSYRFPSCRVLGNLCRTNTPPNTAYRGFGLSDVSLIADIMMYKVANKLGLPLTQVCEVNMFREGEVTITNHVLNNCMLFPCWRQCLEESQFEKRKSQVEEFNRTSPWKKRSLFIVPFKFGIGYRERFLCQGGALINIYPDGSVLLTHGGTEMGQGLHTKMIQIASHVLGISSSLIHIAETSTDKVPNMSSTAASVSTDLNGFAVKAACEEINRRLEPIRKQYPEKTWQAVVREAFLTTVQLSATGFYRSREKGGYEFTTGKGEPHEYCTYGAGCSEIEVDCLTGECQVLQVDMVIDVGRSLNPGIDMGQIEGAFQMGLGVMLMEQASISENGCMLENGIEDYKISTVRNIPRKMNVSLLKNSTNPKGVFSSKGIGEPSICIASSVYLGIREAILNFRLENGADDNFDLDIPASPESVRNASRSSVFKKLHDKTAH